MPKIIPTSTDTIGGRVRHAREAAGLTQEELSKKAGIGQGHLSDIERDNAEPMLRTIRLLAPALAVPPGWLAFGVEPPVCDSDGGFRTDAALTPAWRWGP